MVAKRVMLGVIVLVVVVAAATGTVVWQLTKPPEKKVYYLGLAQHAHNNAWEALFAYGFFWYCEDHGYKGVMLDARLDTSLQLEQVRRLVDMGVDALLLCPVDEHAINPAIDYCKEHNVPVMTSPFLADHDWPLMVVSTSFYEQGAIAGEEMLDFLKEKYGGPNGVVLNLRGQTGHTAADQRSDGFTDYLSAYPEIEILTYDTRWMPEITKDIVETVLPTRPDIDGIYMANLAIVDGCVAGLEALGIDPRAFFMVGLDAGPNVLKYIREDIIDVCVGQPPQWYCPVMAEYLVRYLEEGEAALPKVGDTVRAEDLVITGNPHFGIDWWGHPVWAPADVLDITEEFPGRYEAHTRHLKIPNLIITMENVDDPTIWGNVKLPGW